jgi:hypothetical protein
VLTYTDTWLAFVLVRDCYIKTIDDTLVVEDHNARFADVIS